MTMIMKTCLTLIIAMAAVVLISAPSFGKSRADEMIDALDSAAPADKLRVIVNFKDKVAIERLKHPDKRIQKRAIIEALKANAMRSQASVDSFLKRKGIEDRKSLWIINGMAVTARAEVIRALMMMPGVESVILDSLITGPETNFTQTSPAQWNLDSVGAPDLWALGFAGAGTVVGSMDTGADIYHPDLAASWRGGTNSWYDPNGEHATPFDIFGHGTQTIGVMVGGAAGGTHIGVAPEAKWIAVKIFDDMNMAYLSGIHLGFQWLLDPDGDSLTDDAPDVVNFSWGFDSTSKGQCITTFQDDVSALRAAGIGVAFSAGNDGPASNTSISPANYPESLAIGAVDSSNLLAYFSARGPSACDGGLYPALVAPGVNIRTSDLTFWGLFPDSYAYVSGTSFSSPHVAGSIALLRGAFPDATAEQIELSILSTALDLGPSGADYGYGYGLVDVVAAYNSLLYADPLDADGDGYIAAEDCDDGDPAVYPGAPELKHDGIDQDCNGYDLTIDITKADYNSRKAALSVEATSALQGGADLEAMGYGSMQWSERKSKWSIKVEALGEAPALVTVCGAEGCESKDVSSSPGGGKGRNK